MTAIVISELRWQPAINTTSVIKIKRVTRVKPIDLLGNEIGDAMFMIALLAEFTPPV